MVHPHRPGALARLLVIACASALVAVAAPRVARADTSPAWIRPVDGPVVAPFREPTSTYGAGHRGVDLAAAPGTPVRAANDGTVTFAGDVGGTEHVVVAHSGNLRTSYSFLASVAVHEGQAVGRGDVIGTTGGAGEGHDGTVLHFGLRDGDTYVDPMLLFRPPDLAKLVHLAPAAPPAERSWTNQEERTELRVSLGLPVPGAPAVTAAADDGDDDGGCGDAVPLVGGAISAACDVGEWLGDRAVDAVDAGISFVHAVTGTATAVLDRIRSSAVATVGLLRGVSAAVARGLAATPAGQLALDLVAIGRRFYDTVTADCDDHAPPADGTGGSRHRVMVVAGINSSGAAVDRGPTVALDVKALGYHPSEGEVRYFSYAADGGPYTQADTHGDLVAEAQNLGVQLRAMQREQPGREVDLIGHSQGGIVVDLFLDRLYDPADPTLPPLGNVVTLSTPHEGAPLATAGAEIRDTHAGRVALDDVIGDHTSLPPPNSTAVQELAETSGTVRSLFPHGLPEHLDYTTIGAPEDYVVPPTNISVPGAREDVVPVAPGVSEHSAIVKDPSALAAVRSVLEGRSPPCVSIATALRGAVEPVVLSGVEHDFGAAAAGALRAGG
jgi:hypothetical protein